MIEPLAWALLLWPALATLVLLIELAAAQWPVRPLAIAAAPNIAIIIPAHDEADAIGATVAAIRSAAPPGARLLVIADNCSDATADRARDAGAQTIERVDPAHRGKGYALAFARDHLAGDPPDVVVVVDADCRAQGDAIARLAGTSHAIGRPVQACYLMRPRPELGAMVGLSGFAFLLRNLVRQRGLARLGAPALLTGSGMAFPWDAFAAAPLASGDLVEDLTLGIDLARAGRPAAFLADAGIWSDPARKNTALAQRTRWEQGFLRSALAHAPALIARGSWLGLHLLVPPLALLMLIDTLTLAVLAAWALPVPTAILATLLAGSALCIWLSWARFGREQISGGRLLLAPFYLLWKLPIYAKALVRPERRWLRTERG